MKNIGIVYHSGVGSTRVIVDIYAELLGRSHLVEIHSVEEVSDVGCMQNKDLVIFAFPCYHCEPSPSVMQFVQQLPVFSSSVHVFLVTTFGLYPGNTLRIFAQSIVQKNAKVVGYAAYRSPATDGVLMFPPFEFMFTFDGNVARCIWHDIRLIDSLLSQSGPLPEKPIRFKLYAFLNAPNAYWGRRFKPCIKLKAELCVACYRCVENCPHQCLMIGDDGLPYLANKESCESCYRCIHH